MFDQTPSVISVDQEPAAKDSQSQYFSMGSGTTTLNSKLQVNVQQGTQGFDFPNDLGDMCLIQLFSEGDGEVQGDSIGFGDAPGDRSECLREEGPSDSGMQKETSQDSVCQLGSFDGLSEPMQRGCHCY